VHRETITDPTKVLEIEAALRNKQAASALAELRAAPGGSRQPTRREIGRREGDWAPQF
jgi:hypothetical protein